MESCRATLLLHANSLRQCNLEIGGMPIMCGAICSSGSFWYGRFAVSSLSSVAVAWVTALLQVSPAIATEGRVIDTGILRSRGGMMKSFLRTGVFVAVLLLNGTTRAGEAARVLPSPPESQEPASLPPYPKDWDKRLGDDFFTR